MPVPEKIRVAVKGYGVIGKRVAAAVVLQDDMSLAGVSDVVTDWRARTAVQTGRRLFGANDEAASAMRATGLDVAGTIDDLLGQTDVVVDCNELFYAYMVDNQAIVVPETIDAIRALTDLLRDGDESIAKTNAALGIGTTLV